MVRSNDEVTDHRARAHAAVMSKEPSAASLPAEGQGLPHSLPGWMVESFGPPARQEVLGDLFQGLDRTSLVSSSSAANATSWTDNKLWGSDVQGLTDIMASTAMPTRDNMPTHHDSQTKTRVSDALFSHLKDSMSGACHAPPRNSASIGCHGTVRGSMATDFHGQAVGSMPTDFQHQGRRSVPTDFQNQRRGSMTAALQDQVRGSISNVFQHQVRGSLSSALQDQTRGSMPIFLQDEARGSMPIAFNYPTTYAFNEEILSSWEPTPLREEPSSLKSNHERHNRYNSY